MIKTVPIRMKEMLKRTLHGFGQRPFKPYLKKKNIEGVAFDFWIGDEEGRDWYDLHSSEIWAEMRFIRDYMIHPGDVVIDCGGHHGCTAILLSHWVGKGGKVITFEPLPANGDILEKNIQLNKLQNISLERKAVGAETGLVNVRCKSNSSVDPAGKGVEVALTCLDEYSSLNPSFIKIDVEGFEIQVLQGAKKLLTTHPSLALEVHTNALSRYGGTVQEIFSAIDLEHYKFWIQWEDILPPEEYDMKIPIKKRVHLFCIPRVSSSLLR